MVHMIGGPSFGGYSAYRNHTIAREGQWRMPRNYGYGSTRISIRNYSSCCCNRGGYGGWQVPSWMMWLNAGLGWASQLLGLFAPSPKPEVKPEVKQEDEPEVKPKKKEEEEVVTDPEKPKVEKPKENPETNPFAADFNVTEENIEETTEDKEIETTVKVVNKSTLIQRNGTLGGISGDIYEGYTWQSLADAYGVENTLAFRNAFRKQVLDGKQGLAVGEQNYPKAIKWDGKTLEIVTTPDDNGELKGDYTFDDTKYKPHKYVTTRNGAVTEGRGTSNTYTVKGNTTKTPSATGTATVTYKHSTSGQTVTKTVTKTAGTKEEVTRLVKADVAKLDGISTADVAKVNVKIDEKK